MLEKGVFLTGADAELLSRAIEEVKTKSFEKSKTALSDIDALEVLVSYFEREEKLGPDNEACQLSVNPKGKSLFLGHIIGRGASTDTASGGADF